MFENAQWIRDGINLGLMTIGASFVLHAAVVVGYALKSRITGRTKDRSGTPDGSQNGYPILMNATGPSRENPTSTRTRMSGFTSSRQPRPPVTSIWRLSKSSLS